MTIRPLLFQLVIMFIIGVTFISVSAESNLTKDETIQFYVDDIKPWAYSENGIRKGVLVDWAQAILEESGVDADIVFAPFPRVSMYLKSNRADVALHLYEDSLKDSVEVIGTLTPLKTAIISRKDTEIKSFNDLSNLVVCQTRGIDYSNVLIANKTLKLDNYQVASYEQLNKMLLLGRCDAVISVVDSFFYVARTLGYARNEFAKPFIIETQYGGLLVSKDSKHNSAKQRIKAAYLKLEAQGLLQLIVDKHIGSKRLNKLPAKNN